MKKILIVYNTSWYVYNFRRPLIRRLRALGHEVHVAAPRDAYTGRLEAEEGVLFHELGLEGKGMNPLRDLGTILQLRRLYAELRPLAVLHYTIKPNIYGSIAARLTGTPAINNITGLGAAFSGRSPLQLVARLLYSVAFRGVRRVFFQNPDDRELFLRLGLVGETQCALLPGSGVDTDYFAPRPKPAAEAGRFTFLLVARLLEAKGIGDYAAAAKILRGSHPEARFLLAGDHDPEDPHMVRLGELEEWRSTGLIEWLGKVEDIRPVIARADCVVLPTRYREGVPRSLLEAASMGKPLVASDSVGAREPVEAGVNGYLCKPADPEDLAARMLAVMELEPGRLEAFGAASRRIMRERFEERIVLEAYEREIAAL